MFHSRPCSEILLALAVTKVKAEYLWLSSQVADHLVSHPDCKSVRDYQPGKLTGSLCLSRWVHQL